MSSITLNNLVKKYGDGFAAVNDVSLDIRDGELMILVGPSGCGKSTLLRMIVGLEDITSGDLLIDDKRVNEKAPRERNLSMVFQNYALYPHLSVYENIAFPLRLAKGKHTEEEIKGLVGKAADMLELNEHLERKPANLSGGQRQRVAMGRAIVRQADAFLFDEPLSNLDAKLRGQMRTEISRMQRRLGTTTVYVTHDQTEAMTLGDRVAVLKKGNLEQCASPRELYEQPVNLFVAGFIGSPPMNFLPARVSGGRIELPFAEVELDPALAKKAEGKELLIAGIRPEHFEDAAVMDERKKGDGVTFEVDIDVTEWLGNELYAYVPFEADEKTRAKLDELDRDLDGEGMRTQMVVALDAMSRVRDGEPATLWFDPRRMHLFDPESGENLTRDEDEATRIQQDTEEMRQQSLDRAKKLEAESSGESGGTRSDGSGGSTGKAGVETGKEA